ncbi:Rv2175c family DNA-binding protein [Blastococcus sp. Marseille-P5729]|uniref:Rv2175c family DNA-binding protein n=1 Tax=Blastococcus sp. Marseille-P5729 TaxID=2086582 RepID=UPI00351A6FAC
MSNQHRPAQATQWLTMSEVAAELGVDVPAVKSLLREGGLLAVPSSAGPRVPAALIEDGEVSKYLRGVITLLRDGGYDDAEAVDWLLREDETLGGTPAWALHHQLHREVSRRAQALAF